MRPWKRPPCVPARREARRDEIEATRLPCEALAASPQGHAPRTRCRAGRAGQSATRRCCPEAPGARAWAGAQRPKRACQRPRRASPTAALAAGRAPRAARTQSRGSAPRSAPYTPARDASALRTDEATKRSRQRLRHGSTARKTQRPAAPTRACSSRVTAGFLAFARARASIESARTQTSADRGRMRPRRVPAGATAPADGAARMVERGCECWGALAFLAAYRARRQIVRRQKKDNKPVQRSASRAAPQPVSCRAAALCLPAGRSLCEGAAATHACQRALRRRTACAAAWRAGACADTCACCTSVARLAALWAARPPGPGLRAAAGCCCRCKGRAGARAASQCRGRRG